MNQEDEAQLDDELREEYDEKALKDGVRGKYAQRLAQGSNVVSMALCARIGESHSKIPIRAQS